jgi:hypothetical protein
MSLFSWNTARTIKKLLKTEYFVEMISNWSRNVTLYAVTAHGRLETLLPCKTGVAKLIRRRWTGYPFWRLWKKILTNINRLYTPILIRIKYNETKYCLGRRIDAELLKKKRISNRDKTDKTLKILFHNILFLVVVFGKFMFHKCISSILLIWKIIKHL